MLGLDEGLVLQVLFPVSPLPLLLVPCLRVALVVSQVFGVLPKTL